MRAARNRTRSRSQSGFTLIELLVAGSMLGIVIVGLTFSATITSDLLRIQQSRASQLIVVNALRARFIADARESTEVVCNGDEELVFNVRDGVGSLVAVTEYRVDAGGLVRWRTPPDKAFRLVDDAISLACTDLADEGAEVSVLFGDADRPSHFYVLLAEKPTEGA